MDSPLSDRVFTKSKYLRALITDHPPWPPFQRENRAPEGGKLIFCCT